ncbi:hypothetical protein KA977_09405 [Candidatus Dependentiae bacterium]|nr:hypothetical protein [Candidatus Dependentiae bacterium]
MEDKEKIKKDVDCRKKIQLILSWITLILLIGGYFYPLVGAFVIVMMMTGFIISFFK